MQWVIWHHDYDALDNIIVMSRATSRLCKWASYRSRRNWATIDLGFAAPVGLLLYALFLCWIQRNQTVSHLWLTVFLQSVINLPCSSFSGILKIHIFFLLAFAARSTSLSLFWICVFSLFLTTNSALSSLTSAAPIHSTASWFALLMSSLETPRCCLFSCLNSCISPRIISRLTLGFSLPFDFSDPSLY